MSRQTTPFAAQGVPPNLLPKPEPCPNLPVRSSLGEDRGRHGSIFIPQTHTQLPKQSRRTPLMQTLFPVNLFRRFLPWRSGRLVTQVAGEVARQCRSTLWRRVSRQTASMSVAEVRGYVRAQAAGCVATEVEQVFARRRLKPALRTQVAASALDQLISMVVYDVLSEAASSDANTMAA